MPKFGRDRCTPELRRETELVAKCNAADALGLACLSMWICSTQYRCLPCLALAYVPGDDGLLQLHVHHKPTAENAGWLANSPDYTIPQCMTCIRTMKLQLEARRHSACCAMPLMNNSRLYTVLWTSHVLEAGLHAAGLDAGLHLNGSHETPWTSNQHLNDYEYGTLVTFVFPCTFGPNQPLSAPGYPGPGTWRRVGASSRRRAGALPSVLELPR